jgi:DNA-binding transcriptional MerR regulator
MIKFGKKGAILQRNAVEINWASWPIYFLRSEVKIIYYFVEMSGRILTLFGEEIIPEQIKAVGKSRAKKKPEQEEAKPNVETESAAQPAPAEVAQTETAAAVVQPAPVIEPQVEPLPEDWKLDKKYYTIGEVAELFKVKTSHIRFWTNEFKLKVRTTRKGDRLFTPEQVRELRAIHHLVKERGFTLNGAKAKLKTQNNKDVETIDLKQSLLELRNKLMIIRNQLIATAKAE